MVTVADILKFDSFQGVTVIAGEAGVTNELSWASFSMLHTASQVLSNGDLCVLAKYHPAPKNLVDDFTVFFKTAKKKNVAAVMISFSAGYIPYLPREAKDLADQYRIPVLEVPFEKKYAQMYKDVLGYCMKSNRQEGDAGEVVRLLVSDHSSDIAAGIYRMQNLGVNVNGNFQVAVIRATSDGGKPDATAPISRGLLDSISEKIRVLYERHFASRMLAVYDEQIVLTLSLDSEHEFIETETFARQILNSITTFETEGVRFHLGISSVFASLTEYREAYLQAIRAIQVENIRWNQDPVMLFDNIGIAQILLEMPDPECLRRFYDHHLGRLRDHDEANGGILLDTLRCFCACNFTVDKTAELLYIHKNTLRYRIHRIEEILGISFSSMAQIANIITCIEIEKILHIL